MVLPLVPVTPTTVRSREGCPKRASATGPRARRTERHHDLGHVQVEGALAAGPRPPRPRPRPARTRDHRGSSRVRRRTRLPGTTWRESIVRASTSVAGSPMTVSSRPRSGRLASATNPTRRTPTSARPGTGSGPGRARGRRAGRSSWAGSHAAGLGVGRAPGRGRVGRRVAGGCRADRWPRRGHRPGGVAKPGSGVPATSPAPVADALVASGTPGAGGCFGRGGMLKRVQGVACDGREGRSRGGRAVVGRVVDHDHPGDLRILRRARNRRSWPRSARPRSHPCGEGTRAVPVLPATV